MNGFLSYLELSYSENALYVRFSGVHEDYLLARYMDALDQFCQSMQGKAWARIVDLQQWTVTPAQIHDNMMRMVQQDVKRGLTLEYVLLPSNALGAWQVEHGLKTVNSALQQQIFHCTVEKEVALSALAQRGFCIEFGAVTRHEAHNWTMSAELTTKSNR